jgi:hypothetical protein
MNYTANSGIKINIHTIKFVNSFVLNIDNVEFNLFNDDNLNLILFMFDTTPNVYVYREIVRIINNAKDTTLQNSNTTEKKNINIELTQNTNDNGNENNVEHDDGYDVENNDDHDDGDDDDDEMNRILDECKIEDKNTVLDVKIDTKKEDKKRIFKSISSTVFNAEIYTYNKILENVLDHVKTINLNNLPQLFASKFPIYLWMDGKDLNGNQVRKSILYNGNAYNIYDMIYNSLYNEDYEFPDDDEMLEIINDFNNFLPDDYNSHTVEEIMHNMNIDGEKMNDQYEIFHETHTAQSEPTF